MVPMVPGFPVKEEAYNTQVPISITMHDVHLSVVVLAVDSMLGG